jgi:hypothetical protein
MYKIRFKATDFDNSLSDITSEFRAFAMFVPVNVKTDVSCSL